jgi:hypothetical protein
MDATVIKEMRGVVDGTVEPRLFKVGDVVSGALAKEGIAGGWASDEVQPKATKSTKQPTGKTQQTEQKEPVVEIPDAWKTLKGPDLVALAKSISGADVADAMAAQTIIAAEVAKRAAAPKA